MGFKRFYLAILVTVVCSFSANGQAIIGGSLNFGSLIPARESLGNIGIGCKLGYEVTENFRAMIDGIYFFDALDVVSYFDLNFNVHRIFSTDDNIKPYALGGLNMLAIGIENNDNRNEFSVNLGFGMVFSVGNQVSPFVELKGQFFNRDNRQYVAGLGLLVNL